jgi:hypothetical protein
MAIASATYPSSSSDMSLFAGPPSDMTNNQLQATWKTVEQQAHTLPSDQREHSEDAALKALSERADQRDGPELAVDQSR